MSLSVFLNGNPGFKTVNEKPIVYIDDIISSEIVNIIVPSPMKNDEGLSLAIEDLRNSLNSVKVVFVDNEKVPRKGDLIILGGAAADAAISPWKAPDNESYRIMPSGDKNRRVVAIQAESNRGLMYGALKLSEQIKLGKDPYQVELEESPGFPLRMFSEEGQLLDLPDLNYYSDKSPYVNEVRLKSEIDEAKILVDNVVKLGFNAITFLHVNFEDYIDYKYLDKTIYPENSIHRKRSAVFCNYMNELCDYAHNRHIDIYLQLYEFQYPPEFEGLYTIDLQSPDIENIISAKCKELYERVDLDGLVITPNESHPRCGYRSVHLWEKYGQSGAGRMLTLYHNACAESGKRAIFRLWRIATSAGGAKETAWNIPKGAMFSVKNTGGDFWLNFPLTNIVTDDLGKEYPVMIVFDPFRQYDGWSRTFCYMKKYGERIKTCHEHSISAINAWGSWAPGCIWPTREPDYLRGVQEDVAWAGYWNMFRIFTRGFTAGQSNVYLLGRLMWNPDADPFEVAQDFAHIHLGEPNAKAAAEALMCTQDAWYEFYSIPKSNSAYLSWASIFGPRKIEETYKSSTMQEILEGNKRALEQVDRMNEYFDKTDRDAAPDKIVYDSFNKAIDLTTVTLKSFYLFRECWWRNRAAKDLQGDAKDKNASALSQALSELRSLIDNDWSNFPVEASYWRITYKYGGEPYVMKRDVFPYWWISNTTMDLMISEMIGK
ncbi:MAG: hypothetical protein HQ522_06720 [Bacteroidetes bacterium]|nr:hypothetical protein [Bacteroidota bacterium]